MAYEESGNATDNASEYRPGNSSQSLANSTEVCRAITLEGNYDNEDWKAKSIDMRVS